MNIAERIRDFELFAHFTEEQLEKLQKCTSLVRYPKEVSILKEGDATTDAYLVEGGKVRIQRDTPYGIYVLADLEPGQLFGETSFIDQSPRSGDALVVEDATILPLNAIALDALMESDQRFHLALYWTFWKSLSIKLRQTNEVLANFFSEGGTASPVTADPKANAADIHVGLGTKQDLFREQKLSNLEINCLATLAKEKRLQSGDLLFGEGDEGNSLYVVLEGRVRISKNIPGAGEEALAIMERGDYFGEMSLIDGKPRSADARVHDDGAVVLEIPSAVLSNILDPKKVSSLRLLKILCLLVAKRLREIDDKLVSWFIFSGGSGTSMEFPEP